MSAARKASPTLSVSLSQELPTKLAETKAVLEGIKNTKINNETENSCNHLGEGFFINNIKSSLFQLSMITQTSLK